MKINVNKKWVLWAAAAVLIVILVGLLFRGCYKPEVDYRKEYKVLKAREDSVTAREQRFRQDSVNLLEEINQRDSLIEDQNKDMNEILADNREQKTRYRELKVKITMYEKDPPVALDTVCRPLLYEALAQRDSVQAQFDDYVLTSDTTIKAYKDKVAYVETLLRKRDTLYAKMRSDFQLTYNSSKDLLKLNKNLTRKYRRERTLTRVLSGALLGTATYAIIKR